MEIRTVNSPVRKCGRRKVHGLYLVGGEGVEGGVLDLFTLINPPVPYPVAVHRAPRAVNADAIFNRAPLDSWWDGASAETESRKSAQEQELALFGMTWNKRKHTGECVGVTSVSEAVNVLAETIRYNSTVVSMFRKLTESMIQEVSDRLLVEYNKIHQHLRNYVETQNIQELVALQAAVWRAAYKLPPKKKKSYATVLSAMLYALHLKKDAIELTLWLQKGVENE